MFLTFVRKRCFSRGTINQSGEGRLTVVTRPLPKGPSVNIFFSPPSWTIRRREGGRPLRGVAATSTTGTKTRVTVMASKYETKQMRANESHDDDAALTKKKQQPLTFAEKEHAYITHEPIFSLRGEGADGFQLLKQKNPPSPCSVHGKWLKSKKRNKHGHCDAVI